MPPLGAVDVFTDWMELTCMPPVSEEDSGRCLLLIILALEA
jgi:hypothetical protein